MKKLFLETAMDDMGYCWRLREGKKRLYAENPQAYTCYAKSIDEVADELLTMEVANEFANALNVEVVTEEEMDFQDYLDSLR